MSYRKHIMGGDVFHDCGFRVELLSLLIAIERRGGEGRGREIKMFLICPHTIFPF